MGMLLGLTFIAGTLAPHRSVADNNACWGDNSRHDISCARLTESLLLSLRGESRQQVQKAMNAPGVERQKHWLHFLSNYLKGDGSGSGYLNVRFEDGRATIINAMIDTDGNVGQNEFIWNAYAAPPLSQEFQPSTKDFTRRAYCSDLSSNPKPCKSDTTEQELMRSRMAFGSDKVESLEMLKTSCNVPSIAVSDPNGDCDRLRKLLK
jgi:hypothetical protein